MESQSQSPDPLKVCPELFNFNMVSVINSGNGRRVITYQFMKKRLYTKIMESIPTDRLMLNPPLPSTMLQDWNGRVCIICQADFEENDPVCILPICRHFLHRECLAAWFDHVPSHQLPNCLECRRDFVNADIKERLAIEYNWNLWQGYRLVNLLQRISRGSITREMPLVDYLADGLHQDGPYRLPLELARGIVRELQDINLLESPWISDLDLAYLQLYNEIIATTMLVFNRAAYDQARVFEEYAVDYFKTAREWLARHLLRPLEEKALLYSFNI